MRFEAAHRFPFPPDEVQAAMVDPEFFSQLRDLPEVKTPQVLERDEEEGGVRLRVRYEYSGSLPPVARRLLGTGRLTWVQVYAVDLARHHTDWHIVPDVHAERLSCSGTYRLRGHGDATEREIAGDLTVRVPLLARRAERAMVGGLRDRIDAEAADLRRWLAR